MSKTKTSKTQVARAMVGSGVYHRGEHGTVVAAFLTEYACPMVRVEFGGGRAATLKPSEVGSA